MPRTKSWEECYTTVLLGSTTAPARLTIDTSAEHYGAVAPCEILVNFAITQNSSLRSIAGEIEITGPKGDVLYGSAIQTTLEGSGYGTFQNEVRIGPIDGHICRSLMLDLELFHCDDADGNRIECPQIRVKESLVVKKFSVLGTDLDICFDN